PMDTVGQRHADQEDRRMFHSGAPPPVASEKPQIRAYRWCSPPRIGCAIMSPNRSIGLCRVRPCQATGASAPIIVAGVFRKNAPKVIFVEHDHVVGTLAPR